MLFFNKQHKSSSYLFPPLAGKHILIVKNMQIVFYVVSPNNQAHEDRRKEIQKERARTRKNEKKKKRAKIGMKRQLETQICFWMWPLAMEMMRLMDVSME